MLTLHSCEWSQYLFPLVYITPFALSPFLSPSLSHLFDRSFSLSYKKKNVKCVLFHCHFWLSIFVLSIGSKLHTQMSPFVIISIFHYLFFCLFLSLSPDCVCVPHLWCCCCYCFYYYQSIVHCSCEYDCEWVGIYGTGFTYSKLMLFNYMRWVAVALLNHLPTQYQAHQSSFIVVNNGFKWL